jgi:molecular chaperone GrpE (heat shock protein)
MTPDQYRREGAEAMREDDREFLSDLVGAFDDLEAALATMETSHD